MKVFSGGRDVGDNISDEAQDGGEGDEANDQLKYHIEKLCPGFGAGQVPNGGHGKHRPIDTFQVGHETVVGHGVVFVVPGRPRVFVVAEARGIME